MNNKFLMNLEQELEASAARQVRRGTVAAVVPPLPPPMLLDGQFAESLGSLSPGQLSYNELARHHARVRLLHKPELVAECHQLGVPGNINVAKATL